MENGAFGAVNLFAFYGAFIVERLTENTVALWSLWWNHLGHDGTPRRVIFT